MTNWRVSGQPKISTFTQVSAVPSGSAHTKGSWVQVTASTSHDFHGISVFSSSYFQDNRYLIDIATGAGGSEVVVVPNLYKHAGLNINPYIPIYIPAATRIAVRSQTNDTSGNSVEVRLHGVAGTENSNPGGARIINAAVTADTRVGPQIDPGGVANTKSSWVELVASTGHHIKQLLVYIAPNNSATDDPLHLVDIGIGGAGSEQIFIPDLQQYGKDFFPREAVVGYYSFPCDIPQGSRISARASCTLIDATMRLVRVGIWGIG